MTDIPSDIPSDVPPDPAHRHNARVGLWLFALYLLFYAVFVGITVVDYRIMAKPIVGGVNLAICYGMFLIVAAIVLAVVYMLLCKAEQTPTAAQERGREVLDEPRPIDDVTGPADLPPTRGA